MDFINKWLAQTDLLMYGELNDVIYSKLIYVLTLKMNKVFTDGSNLAISQCEYWLLLSELNAHGFIEYGTSPRGAWLTNEGLVFFEQLTKLTNEEFTEKTFNIKY